MRLAMIQMSNSGSVEKNMEKSLHAIAMCNRVGVEGEMDFAGESLVVHPSGDVIVKADDQEQLIRCELNLGEAREWRDKVPYLGTRRPEWYL